MIQVDIANDQTLLELDEHRLRKAIEQVLSGEGIANAAISLAIIDDATIRPINARHLGHDYATDVLSFLLERTSDRLEGEILVSAETALRNAGRFDWQPADELLLYVIHGALHLVGYDDLDPDLKTRMRTQEQLYLGRFGLAPRYEDAG